MLSEAVQSLVDPRLATLAAILDPVELLRHPDASGWGLWRSAIPADVRVRVLNHHPGSRCTVEIAMRTADGWQECIGKVYAEDRSDVWEAMEAIKRAGFGPEKEFSIPQPFGYWPKLNLLLQEKVRGLPAEKVFLTGTERDRALASERCALWLARFHMAAPRLGRVFDRNSHRVSMERWSRRIAKQGGTLADQAGCLFGRLEEAALALRDVAMCAGHGSYGPSAVILAPGRTTIFDWDGHDLADPSRDVARFLVALRRLALGELGSIRALDGAADVFLETYVAASRPDVVVNLAFYEAAMCVQLAKYDLSHRVPGWRENIETLLGEGLRVLELRQCKDGDSLLGKEEHGIV